MKKAPEKEADSFTKSHFTWLYQLLADVKGVGEDAFVAGFVLKCIHHSRIGNPTNPALATLASTLMKSERRTQAAVAKLVARGHLKFERGGRGRSNRYTFQFFDAPQSSSHSETRPDESVMSKTGRKRPINSAMTGRFCPDDTTNSSESHGHNRPCNLLNEPTDEPTDSLSERNPPSEFDDWWRQYPRREAKGAARKAYLLALKKADAGRLLNGAMKYAASRAGQESRYTKLPATWLNAECWDDEAPPRSKTVAEIVADAASGRYGDDYGAGDVIDGEVLP